MRWHLPSTRWTYARSYGIQKQFVRRHAQREYQGAVAVIRIEPVIAAFHRHARGHQQRLVPGARDLKINFLLALEHDLPVVYPAGEKHQAIDFDALLAGYSVLGVFCFA